MERLDKIISNRTGISRKDAKAAISSGKVTVSGNIIRSSDYKVGENEEIILDGKAECPACGEVLEFETDECDCCGDDE